MILLGTLSIALAAFALYQVSELGKRVKALEARKPEPEKRVSIPTIQQLYPPVENFTPKKPETLRPNQMRGREVDQNVFEFDSKL